eukprot:5869076-Pleurochrysis_carterae.AAC.1
MHARTSRFAEDDGAVTPHNPTTTFAGTRRPEVLVRFTEDIISAGVVPASKGELRPVVQTSGVNFEAVGGWIDADSDLNLEIREARARRMTSHARTRSGRGFALTRTHARVRALTHARSHTGARTRTHTRAACARPHARARAHGNDAPHGARVQGGLHAHPLCLAPTYKHKLEHPASTQCASLLSVSSSVRNVGRR